MRSLTFIVLFIILCLALYAKTALGPKKIVNSPSAGFILYPVSKKQTKEEIKNDDQDTDSSEVLLINDHGHVVHKWMVYSERARLLPNCNLLTLFGMKSGINKNLFPSIPKNMQRYVILELDWNSKIVKKFFFKEKIHHDLHRLANGNTLFITEKNLPQRFRKLIHDRRIRTNPIPVDSIVEIDSQGEIVWRWNSYEHLNLNSCGENDCRSRYKSGSARDWLHLNAINVLGSNKWADRGDLRFHPDNIIITARNWSKIFIISKETGEVVWEYSGDYKGGLSGGHEAHMIKSGNILIFDNGSSKTHHQESYILEVNPVTKKLVWKFDIGKKFYSKNRGSVQRLKNGNTLISDDANARIFEVNKQGKIIWEFQDLNYNFGMRAKRYSRNDCALLEKY